MENKNGAGFSALVLVFSDMSMLEALFKIFSVKDGNEVIGIGFPAWAGFVIAAFILYRLFLRRERTVPQAAAFLAAAYAVTAAVLLLRFVKLPGAVSYMIAMLFWAVPFWRTYALTETPATLEKLTMRLELLVLSLLAMLAFIAGRGGSYIHAVPCAASLALCLASLVVMRTAGGETGSGGRGRMIAVLTAFLLLAAALIAAFLLFASDSVGAAASAAGAALLSAIRLAAELFGRFMTWLVSLLPEPEGGEPPVTEGMPSFEQNGEGAEVGDFGTAIVLGMLCAVAAAAIAVVVLLVLRSRRVRLGGKRLRRISGAAKTRAKRPSLLKGLFDSARFFADSVIYRNTPQGVLVHLERWGRLHRRGRSAGETCRSYLKRLSRAAPERAAALLRLADALDGSFYGRGDAVLIPKSELAELRRAFTAQWRGEGGADESKRAGEA